MNLALREFLAGVKLFGEGFKIMRRNKRLWLLGAVPALITTVLFVTGIVVFGYWVGDVVAWVTPFADDWSERAREITRTIATIALLIILVVVGVVAFTAVTLLIGGPFYEYISEKIEDQLVGTPPDYHASWLRMFLRGLRDSILLVSLSLFFTVPLFCLGFVPVIGQTVIPVLAACVGGWILSLELVGVPFHRRGRRLGDRHRALRTRRALTLGFGVPAYLVCAIPVVAVFVMPAAFAGGTLLAREVLSGAAAPGPAGHPPGPAAQGAGPV